MQDSYPYVKHRHVYALRKGNYLALPNVFAVLCVVSLVRDGLNLEIGNLYSAALFKKANLDN